MLVDPVFIRKDTHLAGIMVRMRRYTDDFKVIISDYSNNYINFFVFADNERDSDYDISELRQATPIYDIYASIVDRLAYMVPEIQEHSQFDLIFWQISHNKKIENSPPSSLGEFYYTDYMLKYVKQNHITISKVIYIWQYD